MTPTPTPQQIIELAREATAPEWFDDGAPGWHMGLDLKKFATLLLERFGQQTAVVQEPYCYTYTEDSEEYFAPPAAYVPNDAIPLYTHPAPAEVQEPLTDDWIRSRCSQTWVFDTVKRWVKEVEAAHGITGSKA